MSSRDQTEQVPPSPSTSGLMLGVDAGGTKTAAWLAFTDENRTSIVGRGRSSAGNPLSVGFVEAMRAIADAVDQARAEARRSDLPIARAVLSVAGSTDRAMTRQIIEWARGTELADKVAVCSDFLPVLAAGTPQGCGLALIAGTGSVAYARGADGRAARFGGWGYLLGDDGSGYAIGREALRLALEEIESACEASPQADPREPTQRTPLTGAVLESLRVDTVPELAQAIYSNPTPRTAIASLAPLVITAAENGDESAITILDHAANDLAGLAARAVEIMNMAGECIPLAVAGGILTASPYLRTALSRALARLGIRCEMRIVDDPLHGCLRLASLELADLGLEWH